MMPAIWRVFLCHKQILYVLPLLPDMKYYHGNNKEVFTIEKHISSRYGFPALFFTDMKKLASLYACFHAKGSSKGYIHSIEFIAQKNIDFKFKLSHSLSFRNLIYQLFKEGYSSVLIQNVIDYPSEELQEYIVSDILVVFDIQKIKSPILENTIVSCHR